MPQPVTNASDLRVEIEICRSGEHVHVNKATDSVTETDVEKQCERPKPLDIMLRCYLSVLVISVFNQSSVNVSRRKLMYCNVGIIF